MSHGVIKLSSASEAQQQQQLRDAEPCSFVGCVCSSSAQICHSLAMTEQDSYRAEREIPASAWHSPGHNSLAGTCTSPARTPHGQSTG